MSYQDDPAPTFTNQAELAPLTLEALLKWHAKVGLDNSAKKYAHAREYKVYNALRGDSMVHCARTFFSEDTYVAFIEAIGYGKWEGQARTDHQRLQQTMAEEREYIEQQKALREIDEQQGAATHG